MAPVEPKSFPPELVYEEKLFRCGYSPRAMHLELTADRQQATLYVGCKDGSLWRTGWSAEGEERLERIAYEEHEVVAGIRSLLGFGADTLLVGRSDGEIGLLELNREEESPQYVRIGDELSWLGQRNDVEPPRYGGSIRSISQLDPERFYISFRKLGTLIVSVPGAGQDGFVPSGELIREAIESAVRTESWLRYRNSGVDELRGLRAAERLVVKERPDEWIWLLIDEEGGLFSWSGNPEEAAESLGECWPRGEHPVLVNDYSRVRSRPEEMSRGLFLATDLGVHFLRLHRARNEQGRPELEFIRLSLPGLGPVCMALSYVEDEAIDTEVIAAGAAPAYRYLWAADTAGDSHLFCDEREADRPNLRPSGFSHLDSQVMLAIVDRQGGQISDGGILFCAQVRRDDQIAIGSFRMVPSVQKAGETTTERVRRILSRSGSDQVLEYLLEDERKQGWSRLDGEVGRGPLADSWRDAREDLVGNNYQKAALVSDLVQCVAEDPSTRSALEEFLSNPSARETGRFLDSILASGEVDDAMKALDLWTISFLGVIHRYLARDPATGVPSAERAQRFSLGLLRWLEDVERRADRAARNPEVLHRLETCARMVRKWGLFAHEVHLRESLTSPIRVMRRGQQATSDEVPAGHRVDLLTHESLLFARGVDLLWEENRYRMDGRSAWAVDGTRLEDAEGTVSSWLAVSWNWGGIEIYRVEESPAGTAPPLELVAVVAPDEVEQSDGGSTLEPWLSSCDGRRDPQEQPIPRKKYGYSRAICLGPAEDGRSLHLLCNLAHAREETTAERLFLFVLPVDGGRLRVEAAQEASAWVELEGPSGENPSESVYSLLHLGGRRFLAGLRGNAGRAKVQGFRIVGGSLEKMGEPVNAPTGLRMERSEGDADAKEDLDRPPPYVQNRVWTLTRPWEPAFDLGNEVSQALPKDRHEVLIGCESGEIWRLFWPVDEELSPALFTELPSTRRGFDLMARLGSAVESLAYRVSYEDPRIRARIFAGGEDGAIVAWQELRTPARNDEAGGDEATVDSLGAAPAGDEELPFAPLWATIEGGPVSQIQLWQYELDDPKAPPVLVVAICRDGTAVLFDDRDSPHEDYLEEPPHPRRIQFPGNRHSRLCLGQRAVAAGLWRFATLGLENPADPSFLGVIVSATDKGRIRLQGLDHPRYTPKRKQKYHQLVDRWWSAARNRPTRDGRIEATTPGDPGGEAEEGSSPARGDWEYQFHLGDAVHGATPFLALILVRCLLDPRLDRSFGPLPSALREIDFDAIDAKKRAWWQFPRHLRPLLGLRQAWNLDRPSPREAGEYLDQALRRARDLNDVILFQEICESALKRANFHLYREAGRDDSAGRHAVVKELYFRIFEAIELALESWRGAPDRAERRVRVVVAKHLVDGDTFLRVMERAAGEGSKGPFSEVLRKRVVGIRQLIFARDPIVSLEALRSANWSLMRLCRRLVVRRERALGASSRDWTPKQAAETQPQEVRWEEFRLYFEQLTFAAAQAFQGSAELSFPLAHEFARTFALAVCACPSATIRIANRMTETRLITDLASDQDLCKQVERQMEVLGTIGLTVPDFARSWFHHVTRGPGAEIEGWFPVLSKLDELISREELDEPGSVDAFEECLAPEVGLQNAQDIFCLHHLHGALEWIDRLTAAMTRDATELDLSRSTFEAAEDRLARLTAGHVGDLYKDSARFWDRAFQDLQTLDARHPLFLDRSDQVSHRALGVSLRIQKWARKQIECLESAYKKLEIFQPEYAVFKGILSRLETSTRGFARSAAVQKSVVTAVLGHHMLEDLDEHIFELEEIAMVLDPVQVRRFRESGRAELPEEDHGSMARRFSTYLLRRAKSAESLPKNLRMLYGLLESGEGRDPDTRIPLSSLLEPHGWLGSPPSIPDGWTLSPEVAAHLDLVFEELHQNHLKHARCRGTGSDVENPTPRALPEVEVVPEQLVSGGRMAIRLRFRFEPGDENCERLQWLEQRHCDHPISPSSNPEVASSGAGLYLASLAAAAVGWQLAMHVECPQDEGLGTLDFVLGELVDRDVEDE